jgi:hypothetical protein
MELVFGHGRSDARNLQDLMAVWRGIIACQGLLTAGACSGFEGKEYINLFDRDQGPRLTLMAHLPSWPSAAGRAARPLQVGGITRWRARRCPGVLLQAFQQVFDGCLQDCHTGFERQDIRLRFGWSTIPDGLG